MTSLDLRHEGSSYYTRPSNIINCEVKYNGKWISNKEYLKKFNEENKWNK